jgi:predicted transport protein
MVKIERQNFKKEVDLQSLIETHLEELMAIRFIENQYPIPNGRLDTLGIDEDNVPVVIEYKKEKDSAAIVQGLFYLDWVKANKRTIDLVIKEKLNVKVDVNWGVEPRLIIVAKSFNEKELSAINQIKPSVELKKYSYYGDLFNIEDVNITRTVRMSGDIDSDKGTRKRKLNDYTLDGLLDKAAPQTRQVFEKLRERILGLSDDVWEKVGRSYCDYRTSSTFASPNLQKDGLKVYIKMGDKSIDDPKGLSESVPESYGFGKLNRLFKINSEEQVDYAMKLIKQAYEYVS